MEGKIIIRSPHDLARIENMIMDELNEGAHLHIVSNDHECQDHGRYELCVSNRHPTIKCIIVEKNMIHEIKILDAVLRQNNLEGLFFWCPCCPSHNYH